MELTPVNAVFSCSSKGRSSRTFGGWDDAVDAAREYAKWLYEQKPFDEVSVIVTGNGTTREITVRPEYITRFSAQIKREVAA